jgi:hypothetical protein
MLRAASLAVLLLLAALVGACGGGGGAADADPATAVPGDALVYLEATVRPEGDLREDAVAAAGKVLRTADPQVRIRELLEQGLSDAGDQVDYHRDIAPWLGERAGMWVSTREDQNGDPGVAAVVAATDVEEAESAIEESRRRNGTRATERTHRDVAYKVDAEGFAYGFAGDFVLFGDEPELKRTIDALEGDSLAETDRYRDAVGGLADERLAHFFVDLKGLIELGTREDPEAAEQLRQLGPLFPFDRLPPAAGAFLADGDRLAVDMAVRLPRGGLPQLAAFGWGSTPLLRELPADSWAVQGAARLGETMRVIFDQFAGAAGGAVAKEQLRRQLGLDLEQDVFSWVGDAAFFVRGSSLGTLDGGAVVQVTDEERAANAFGKIVGAARSQGAAGARPVRISGAESAFAFAASGAPRPVVLARGSGKVVVAYGEEAAAAALSPDETLGDTDVFERAESVLGDGLEPSFLLSVPQLVSLIDAAAEGDPRWGQARPYLEAFDVLTLGGATERGQGRARVAAGLR